MRYMESRCIRHDDECQCLSLVKKSKQSEKMKKYMKSRRKFKLFFLFTAVCLLFISIVILKYDKHADKIDPFMEVIEKSYSSGNQVVQVIPELYNEHDIKSRLMQDKVKQLTQNRAYSETRNQIQEPAKSVTRHVHIFYTLPVVWYKRGVKMGQTMERIHDSTTNTNTTAVSGLYTQPSLNIAFYPSLGLYKPSPSIIRKHFENIRNCGIGVLIVTLGPKLTEKLLELAFDLATSYNLTITIEINAQRNRSLEHIDEQLQWVRNFEQHQNFYKIFSISKNKFLPFIYVRNAFKIDTETRLFCPKKENSFRRNYLDAIFIGHVRLKQHVDIVRRLCFDGFYTRLVSNGATFASTWKNWSYLKSFAETYKMLFVPTVGPGYAEKNKTPRHGNMQRHRSNGRYYDVAWQTAITNHVGLINIASYNNWPEGTQIEEAVNSPGFMDYAPSLSTKYLDLTTHWIQNFIVTANKSQKYCNEYLNNTVC